MKIRYFTLIFSFLLLSSIKGFSQTILIQEDFTTYDGTSLTVPAGWTISSNSNYTSVAYSGLSGPNSYRFSTNGATVTTPMFVNADTVRFWMRGASVDTISSLTILYTVNNVYWDTLSKLTKLTNLGRSMVFPVPDTAVQLQFIYSKSVGNLAFDDFLLTGTTTTGAKNIVANPGQAEVYPNPSAGITTINCVLPTNEKLTIELYNTMGQKIRSIANGEMLNAGEYTYHFQCPAPGVYIVRIQEGQQVSEKKLIRVE